MAFMNIVVGVLLIINHNDCVQNKELWKVQERDNCN